MHHHTPVSNVDSDTIDHDHSYFSNSSILAEDDNANDDADQFLLSTDELSSNSSNQAGDNGVIDIFAVTLQFIMFIFGYYHAAIILNFIYVFKLNYERNLFVDYVLRAQVDSHPCI